MTNPATKTVPLSSTSFDYGRYLNIGCGPRYRPGWKNVEMNAQNSDVLSYDVRKGLPFPDGSFSLVYHSHFLEHLSRSDGEKLLRECYRVLEPNGIIRIVVPDLERTVRDYLLSLEKSVKGEAGWNHNHQWMTIELLGLLVGEESVPMMFDYLRRPDLPNLSFVKERVSADTLALVPEVKRKPCSLFARIASSVKRRVIENLLTSKEQEALRIGLARSEGHIHKWMYDRVSLSFLLNQIGFTEVKQESAGSSRVVGWEVHGLDINPDGSDHQKCSLYMEAIKK